MEPLLILLLFIQIIGQSQERIDTEVAPDVEVQRFSLYHYRGAPPNDSMSGSANPTRRRRDFRRDIENRNSIENRSRDMRDLEDSVQNESEQSKPVDVYRYRLELKNSGSKIIKWIFFDYQVSDPSDPDNPSHRQFACAVTIKPNASRSLDAYTTLPPRRVISAAAINAKPFEKPIINRLEYSDGASWQRSDWHLPDQMPGRETARGPCRAI
jgi:hypothetical protein